MERVIKTVSPSYWSTTTLEEVVDEEVSWLLAGIHGCEDWQASPSILCEAMVVIDLHVADEPSDVEKARYLLNLFCRRLIAWLNTDTALIDWSDMNPGMTWHVRLYGNGKERAFAQFQDLYTTTRRW